MTEAKKVVFANEDATVHLLLSETPNEDGSYDTESQVFLPGYYVDQEKVPDYLIESIKAGTAPGLELMSESRAEEVKQKAELIRNLGKDTVHVQGPASEGDEMAASIKAAKSS